MNLSCCFSNAHGMVWFHKQSAPEWMVNVIAKVHLGQKTIHGNDLTDPWIYEVCFNLCKLIELKEIDESELINASRLMTKNDRSLYSWANISDDYDYFKVAVDTVDNLQCHYNTAIEYLNQVQFTIVLAIVTEFFNAYSANKV